MPGHSNDDSTESMQSHDDCSVGLIKFKINETKHDETALKTKKSNGTECFGRFVNSFCNIIARTLKTVGDVTV